MSVVVRFAPSPTGPLHVGGVRTCLYNFLLARKLGGKLLLRIEDTDQTRFVAGAEKYIIETFEWLGITFDESVDVGGPHAPYRQSERSALYQQYVQQLLDSGQAYRAFDTPEELEAMRARYEALGVKGVQYAAATRGDMRNSLSLSADEVLALLAANTPHVIRLAVPADQQIVFNDQIRGEVVVNSNLIDDKVLMKSDGLPTYHLANVVDDHLMEVTHVIRGEEWLPSAPLHVLLYRAFGWEATMPSFAHLPLILRPDGNGKLSKRDGDRLGVPVFSLDWTDPLSGEKSSGYREGGYLPAALLNFLALQGWNPGTEEEVMSIERITELFSLERVSKSGAKFDIEKLHWFQQTYLRSLTDQELLPAVSAAIQDAGFVVDDAFVLGLIPLMKERITFASECVSQGRFFFEAPKTYDEKLAKKWNATAQANLLGAAEALSQISNWTSETVHQAFTDYTQSKEIPNGQILPALRLAITGIGAGPSALDVAAVLGKTETLARLAAIQALPVQG